jgi:hypothetical protein
MPFSDGVWFDPNVQLLKMWYYAGDEKAGCQRTRLCGAILIQCEGLLSGAAEQRARPQAARWPSVALSSRL